MYVCFLWRPSRCLCATLLIRQAEEKLGVFPSHWLKPPPPLRSCKQVPKRQRAKSYDELTATPCSSHSVGRFTTYLVQFFLCLLTEFRLKEKHLKKTNIQRKFFSQVLTFKHETVNCVRPYYYACWHAVYAAGLRHLPQCLRQTDTRTQTPAHTHSCKGRQRLKKETGPAASSLMFNSERGGI